MTVPNYFKLVDLGDSQTYTVDTSALLKRIAELEAACRTGLATVILLRCALDALPGSEHDALIVETAPGQRVLEKALGQ